MGLKITRKLMKIFGSTAGLNQRSEFGSLAAGAPTYATDPDTIQANGNWLGGWYSAVLGGNSPAIQDMNAKDYVFAYQLAYILQNGVGEWLATTEYFIGSVVLVGNRLFTSLINNNLNYAVTDTTKWEAFNPMSVVGDLIYSSSIGGKPAKLAPNTTTVRKYLSMTGTGLAGAAPAWVGLTTPNIVRITANTTYTPSAGATHFKLRIVGGGGSGGFGAATGNAGGASSFGALVTCNGGLGGSQSALGPNGGVRTAGPGGAVAIAAPAITLVSTSGSAGGAGGAANTFNNVDGASGQGGSSPFGGAGAAEQSMNAAANSGSGGGGLRNSSGAGGGGSGGYAEIMVKAADFAANYAVVIGAGGAAVSGSGVGGSGIAIIEEYF